MRTPTWSPTVRVRRQHAPLLGGGTWLARETFYTCAPVRGWLWVFCFVCGCYYNERWCVLSPRHCWTRRHRTERRLSQSGSQAHQSVRGARHDNNKLASTPFLLDA